MLIRPNIDFKFFQVIEQHHEKNEETAKEFEAQRLWRIAYVKCPAQWSTAATAAAVCVAVLEAYGDWEPGPVSQKWRQDTDIETSASHGDAARRLGEDIHQGRRLLAL